MDAKPAHPSPEALSDYGLGKLDGRAAEVVGRHLETCSACRDRVAAVSADSFLGRVRDVQAGAGAVSAFGPSGQGGSVSYRGAAVPPPAESLPPALANHPDYEVKRELGRGGMGVVYLAHNTLMDRDEVLKVMGRQIIERPGVLDRFLREIRAVASLRHPNIVTAYSASRVGDSIVFAMEFVDGLDLSRLVKAKGPLPVAHACHFVHQAALGLQHAHEAGLVHRDIKPHNLMLAREGAKATVKVLDFGLAKATREQKVDGALTSQGQAIGTPDYIAPEQILDAPSADIRADIYSLGGTLYYLLTGRPPFRATSLYDIYQAHISRDADPLNFIRPEVPAELAALVAKMMAKDPGKRFQTPADVARALSPFFKKANAGKAAPSPDVSRFGPSHASPPSVMPSPVSKEARRSISRESGGGEPVIPEFPRERVDAFPQEDSDPDIPWPSAAEEARRPDRKPLPAALAAVAGLLVLGVALFLAVGRKRDDPSLGLPRAPEPPKPPVAATQDLAKTLPVLRESPFKAPNAPPETPALPETLVARTVPRELPPVKTVPQNSLLAATDPGRRYALYFDPQRPSFLRNTRLKYDGKTPITVEAYVRPFGLVQGKNTIISDAENAGIDLSVKYGGTFEVAAHALRVYRSVRSRPTTIGKRTHVAGVLFGQHLSLFVDGKNEGAVDLPGPFKPSRLPFAFGANPNPDGSAAEPFDGIIEQVRISRSARYADAFTLRPELEADANTVLLYKFERDTGSIAYDVSGHGNPGAIVNADPVLLLDAPLAAVPPVADGKVSPGEYGPPLKVDFARPDSLGHRINLNPNGPPWSETVPPSDFSYELSTAHSRKSLFLAFRVTDDFLDDLPEDNGRVFCNDAVELFFDGDRVANDFHIWKDGAPIKFGREGFQIDADAGGRQLTVSNDFTNQDWQVATSRFPGGYVIEFEIPLALIDTADGDPYVPATTGSFFWFNAVVLDNDTASHGIGDYAPLWQLNQPGLGVSQAIGGERLWRVGLSLSGPKDR